MWVPPHRFDPFPPLPGEGKQSSHVGATRDLPPFASWTGAVLDGPCHLQNVLGGWGRARVIRALPPGLLEMARHFPPSSEVGGSVDCLLEGAGAPSGTGAALSGLSCP